MDKNWFARPAVLVVAFFATWFAAAAAYASIFSY